MTANKMVSPLVSDVAEKTLKGAPARLLAFLQGAANPAIASSLLPIGWSKQRVEEGWGLLNQLKAANLVCLVPAPVNRCPEGIAYCEEWQDKVPVRVRAMLQLSHPDQREFLMGAFLGARGMAAVVDAETFVKKCHALEQGTGRAKTRKADLEALAVLEQIGASKSDRKHLQHMIRLARTAPIPPADARLPEDDTSQLEVLRRIYAWLLSWSEMARTVITRRDQLITLGIAKRRPTKAKAGATENRAM